VNVLPFPHSLLKLICPPSNFGKLLAELQSQTRPLLTTRVVALHLAERLEKARLMFGPDADACIAHAEVCPPLAVVLLPVKHNTHLTLFCKLDSQATSKAEVIAGK
jgi:hypothetical protein